MKPAPSARGLFSATGNVRRERAMLIDGKIVLTNRPKRRAGDFYPTPPECLDALMASVEGPRIRAFTPIWEPCAGDGALCKRLARHGVETVASDIADRGYGPARIVSVYEVDKAFSRAVVTNPPFSECGAPAKARMIEHLLSLDLDYLCLLLPLGWDAPAGHAAFLTRWPVAREHLMTWKVDFTGEGSPPSYFCWFVWERGFAGPTLKYRMPRVDAGQGVMFGGRP